MNVKLIMSEFIERTGFEPTASEYAKIEKAYYDFNGNKDEFCKAFVKYGGEDLDAFTERVYGAVKGIAEHAAGECILIVSHGMAIRRFLTEFPEKAGEVTDFIGNCGVLEMTYADGKLTVEKVIDPNGYPKGAG